MTSRSRSLPLLVVAVLATCPAPSRGQDVPLYRDPSPTEGPRIEGPLLPARPVRPALVPPPPSGLGPFQAVTPDLDASTIAPPPAEPLREPLLGVPPMPPPLPALPMPPMRAGGDVEFKRTTMIRGPNGVLGRFHEWFHDAFFGTNRPTGTPIQPRRGFFGVFHPASSEGDSPTRLFNWPAWPAWPLSNGR
jgi:hypothetical protein